MATTLPSFVELMASLGINNTAPAAQQTPSSSPRASPRPKSSNGGSPALAGSSPRDSSSSRARNARYSPYSPISSRRSSLSSSSSISENGSLRSSSRSPSVTSSPRLRKRSNQNLTINVYGSAADLSANTPISIFVRRKTPGTSPTSPTFPRDSCCNAEALPDYLAPLSLPTLPPLLPLSANSEDFPITPDSDSFPEYPMDESSKSIAETEAPFTRRSRRTGTRISTPPSSAGLGRVRRHRQLVRAA
ncbi:hypothetical protein HGRIS_009665 [Hohenbuehelia grisea]|uniref:Uncharacterized protein n=1 Tax=Hohenbuehelia grisea TaxID=104357 RepID=A0ABR3J2C3_9AGAR